MTTKISTVFDYYITQLGVLYPSKKRIPNPYSLADNSIQFLQDSYGLKLGSQTFFRAEMCYISEAYNFVVVLCREVVRQDHDITAFDDAIKSLKEDTFLLREFFYDKDNMSTAIDKIELGSTGPASFFIAGKTNFIFTETIIQTVIRESYT